MWPQLVELAVRVRLHPDEHVREIRLGIDAAIGVSIEGRREVLGMWFPSNEGAKVLAHRHNRAQDRGSEDLFIVCCDAATDDGLKDFPGSHRDVFPISIVQVCIVHVIRTRLRWCHR